MRKLLQYLLKRPLTWMAEHLASSPKREAVFKSLSKLYKSSENPKSKRVCSIDFNTVTDNFIIFSDQHKGNKDFADDFKNCEANYIAALQYYHQQCYNFINLGDGEELWKYKVADVLKNNTASLQAEANFQPDKKYFRTFGNHDIIWKNKIDVEMQLKNVFHMPMAVTEGIVLRTAINDQPLHIFLTHGHQGDKMSDNNALSTWIIAHIWTPIQRYLRININSPSKDDNLRNKHNKLMYEWSSKRKNLLLVTGHTHVPVFASGKYSDHPANNIDTPEKNKAALKPTYFNSGCCCFNDGDITGIEIAEEKIALVKWHTVDAVSKKIVLEEINFNDLLKDL